MSRITITADHECEYCGQILPPPQPAGVYLTPIEERIFLLVRRAGQIGILSPALSARVWEDDPNGGPEAESTLRYHVWKMNKKLRPTGVLVRANKGGNHIPRRYRIINVL